MTEARPDIPRIPIAALILANLTPAAGVLFLGWDARYLLLLYWLENLVVGGWTLVRMLHTGGWRSLPQAAFFTFHYSFFCAGHGMFIIALASGGAEGDALPDSGEEGFPLLIPLHLLADCLAWVKTEVPGLLGLPLLAFVISHGVSTAYHHFIGREDAARDAEDIMFDPYKRIVALHIAIILSAIVILETGAGDVAPALMMLVAIKTAIDVHQHRAVHRQRRRVGRTKENGADDGAVGGSD
ncbi:MAG: DUF6498-containing protein [Zoogloeaceae bacterium]|nr:DUF6498-containing protein [Zoogloeaceae bacterium]